MTEIQSWFGRNCKPDPEKEMVVYTSENAPFGLSLSYNLRLLFTGNSQGMHLINFRELQAPDTNVFLIPAGHVYYLPYDERDFLLLEINSSQLNNQQKILIFRNQYPKDKVLPLWVPDQKNEIPFKKQLMADGDLQYGLLPFLWSRLLPSLMRRIPESEFHKALQYIPYAEAFLAAIKETRLVYSLQISDFTSRLHIHPNTLRRACALVFGRNPKEILHRHIMGKTLFFLWTHPDKPLNEIADLLGFSEPSVFARYLKTSTGMPPNRMRMRFKMLIP